MLRRYYPINGQQDDTRLWNVARSAADISKSYCRTKEKGGGLLGFWRFEDTEGPDVKNEVGDGPAGVMFGDVFRVTVRPPRGVQGPSRFQR